MKQGKNPTRAQKGILALNGLSPSAWVIVKNLPNTLIVKHRETGEIKVIEKED